MRLSHFPRLLAFTLLCALVTACSGISSDIEYDEAYDFARLKTFSIPPAQGLDPARADWVVEAVRENLEKKGYRMVGAEPDFTVSLTAEREVVTYAVRLQRDPVVRLTVDIRDARLDKTVWKGQALVDPPRTYEIRQTIKEAVDGVMTQFPPGQ